MGKLFLPIEEESFKEKVDIRFKNINEGFSKFKSYMLENENAYSIEENFISFMEKAFHFNGEENSFCHNIMY